MQMYERYAGPLGAQAVTRALESSRFCAREITHLVTVSCTGFSAPGLDLSIVQDCGLSSTVARMHIGFMGCHGAINGIRVAQAIAEANSQARVLLCAVELCTLHQQYGWHPDRIVSNALFADGASAFVGSSYCPGDESTPKVAMTGSTVVPDTEELMQWRVRDHGFEMTLSPQVPDVIQATLRPWLCDWLEQRQLSIDDIGGWAIHPGGPKILQACSNALGFQHQQLSPSQSVLAEYGNMSSPTVLFILQRLLQQRASLPYMMLAFGPGLTIEAALIL
jgi:predicted naringenin-chalcone synthase